MYFVFYLVVSKQMLGAAVAGPALALGIVKTRAGEIAGRSAFQITHETVRIHLGADNYVNMIAADMHSPKLPASFLAQLYKCVTSDLSFLWAHHIFGLRHRLSGPAFPALIGLDEWCAVFIMFTINRTLALSAAK